MLSTRKENLKMWIKLIFLNIGNFLKNKPVLFVFIIISQIICIISAFTVAGMMDAVTQPPDVEDDRSIWEKAFQVDFGNYNYEIDGAARYALDDRIAIQGMAGILDLPKEVVRSMPPLNISGTSAGNREDPAYGDAA